jgi:hypothetical protein
MKLQVGKILLNRTKKYLTPCIREYGQEFEKRMNGVVKVAIGIGDIITIKSGIRFEKHIFILIDTSPKPQGTGKREFKKFLDWLRDEMMYEDDYVFDDVRKGHLHMVVIKLPEKYYYTYETFRMSQFSKMYDKEDLDKFFNKRPEIKKVLIKDHSYRIEFVKSLNEMFGTTVDPEEFEGELDMPLRKEDEIFNAHLTNGHKKKS